MSAAGVRHLVCRLDQLEPGMPRRVEVGGRAICVVRCGPSPGGGEGAGVDAGVDAGVAAGGGEARPAPTVYAPTVYAPTIYAPTVYAIDDTCSHEDYSLAEGTVDTEACEIECWKHGSLFSLVTGEALTLPATQPVATHPVELDGDDVVVVLP